MLISDSFYLSLFLVYLSLSNFAIVATCKFRSFVKVQGWGRNCIKGCCGRPNLAIRQNIVKAYQSKTFLIKEQLTQKRWHFVFFAMRQKYTSDTIQNAVKNCKTEIQNGVLKSHRTFAVFLVCLSVRSNFSWCVLTPDVLFVACQLKSDAYFIYFLLF